MQIEQANQKETTLFIMPGYNGNKRHTGDMAAHDEAIEDPWCGDHPYYNNRGFHHASNDGKEEPYCDDNDESRPVKFYGRLSCLSLLLLGCLIVSVGVVRQANKSAKQGDLPASAPFVADATSAILVEGVEDRPLQNTTLSGCDKASVPECLSLIHI